MTFNLLTANKNVTNLVDTSSDSVAHYEYNPFRLRRAGLRCDTVGGITSATGDKKDNFNFRFSTKYLDTETGLYYYGYRYYSPELGRWINKDPIEERGSQLIRSPESVANEREKERLILLWKSRFYKDGSGGLALSTADNALFYQALRERFSCSTPSRATGCFKEQGDSWTSTQEAGFYLFVYNDPLNHVDALGERGIPWGKLLMTGGFGALCRCGGCIAAIDIHIGTCSIFFDDVEWGKCVCDRLADSGLTRWLCKSCAFLVGDPVQWARDYMDCDAFEVGAGE